MASKSCGDGGFFHSSSGLRFCRAEKVVESETAALLLLGCDSVNHPVVEQQVLISLLGARIPHAENSNRFDTLVGWASARSSATIGLYGLARNLW